jgi:hypothetical protein
MDAANSLLQSLRDFGWPILAYAIFAPISTFVLPSSRSRKDRVQRLLLVGAIIAAIEAFFFIGTESGDALDVVRLHPAWGVYVFVLVLVLAGLMAWWWLVRSRQNRVAISINEDMIASVATREMGRGFYLTLIGLLAIGAVGAVFWLSRIADTSSR